MEATKNHAEKGDKAGIGCKNASPFDVHWAMPGMLCLRTELGLKWASAKKWDGSKFGLGIIKEKNNNINDDKKDKLKK